MTAGIPVARLVVYPAHRRLTGRKAVYATRRLSERFAAWQAGHISFAEFDASVQGWINHVRYADTWALREHVLGRLVWGPAESEAASRDARSEKISARPPFVRSQSQ